MVRSGPDTCRGAFRIRIRIRLRFRVLEERCCLVLGHVININYQHHERFPTRPLITINKGYKLAIVPSVSSEGRAETRVRQGSPTPEGRVRWQTSIGHFRTILGDRDAGLCRKASSAVNTASESSSSKMIELQPVSLAELTLLDPGMVSAGKEMPTKLPRIVNTSSNARLILVPDHLNAAASCNAAHMPSYPPASPLVRDCSGIECLMEPQVPE